MIKLIIAFIVMLNPFALFLYLDPIRKNLNKRKYYIVLFKASFISFIIYAIFVLSGNFLFQGLFQISFESFRIFGGIVIFSFAYQYIVGGREAMIKMKGSLDDLASEIALPFMVGAGTISIAILMTYSLSKSFSLMGVFLALLINYIIIVGMGSIREVLHKKRLKVAFDKNMGILLRLMGFFLGAIGINMIIEGIKNLIQ